ncbi:bifunctional metallophosphatase/5'-nucleotidase [Brachybacterium sp. DNPG3]
MPLLPARSTCRVAARRTVVGLGAAVLALGSAALLPFAAEAAETGDQVQLLTFNDFHGALSAADGFACTVVTAEAANPNTVLLSGGDSVGGSEFSSSLLNDEPTLDYLNALGVSASAIGNHEYDQGADDLTGRIESSADFPYLAANVYVTATGERAHTPYTVVDAGDVKVAVVGAVTTKTVGKVSPAAIEGLEFRDPVDSVNEAIAELDASGEAYDVLVVSYHEGASGDAAAVGEAPANTDPIFEKIVTETSAEADAIFNGDSHQLYAYDAPVPGQDGEVRPIVQTGSSGEYLGSVTLELGTDGDWDVVADGTQLIETESADLAACADDATFVEASTIATDAIAEAAVEANNPVGTVSADITTAWDDEKAQYVDGVRTATGATGGADIKGDDRSSFSTAGNMLADSMAWFLEDRGGYEDQQVIGWMNPGGIRSEFWYAQDAGEGDGVVTYGEANNVVRFGNTLNTGEVTGAQFVQMLEEQWQRDASGVATSEFYAFGVSDNVTYTYDPSAELDQHIIDVQIDGEPVDPDATYTIVTASFLFEGGDNMHTLAQATNVQDTGVLDRDALSGYFQAEENADLAPDYSQRQLGLEVVESGEYDEAAGVDTDPVLRLSNLDSLSLGAPEITSVTVDAGEYGTFSADYTQNAETGEYSADVTLEDWLCVPEGTEVPITVTAVPDTGTAITIDLPSFTWTEGGAPEACTVPVDDGSDDDGSDDGSQGSDDDAQGSDDDAQGSDDDAQGTDDDAQGTDDDSAASDAGGSDDQATGGSTTGGSTGTSTGGSTSGGSTTPVRGDLARTGVPVGFMVAGVAALFGAGACALGTGRRLGRD